MVLTTEVIFGTQKLMINYHAPLSTLAPDGTHVRRVLDFNGVFGFDVSPQVVWVMCSTCFVIR